MTGNADLNITSQNTKINVTSTGSAGSYGIRLEPSLSGESKKAGNAYINNNSTTGTTEITVASSKGSSYGLQSSANGEIKIGGAALKVKATASALSKNAYAVCNDKNTNYSTSGAVFILTRPLISSLPKAREHWEKLMLFLSRTVTTVTLLSAAAVISKLKLQAQPTLMPFILKTAER